MIQYRTQRTSYVPDDTLCTKITDEDREACETQQSQLREASITRIMEEQRIGVAPSNMRNTPPQYADISEYDTLADDLDYLAESKYRFESSSASADFPSFAAFLQWLATAKLSDLKKYGLKRSDIFPESEGVDPSLPSSNGSNNGSSSPNIGGKEDNTTNVSASANTLTKDTP